MAASTPGDRLRHRGGSSGTYLALRFDAQAPTVAVMFAAVLGILLGVAVVGGPLLWLDAPTAALADSMVLAVADGGAAALSQLPNAAEHPQVVALFATVIALSTPGVVALGLAVAARAVRSGRQMLSGLFLIAATASFLVLPAPQAALLLTAAAVCTAALLAPASWLTQVALWTLASVLAGHHAVLLLTGSAPAVDEAVASFTALSGLNSPEFWRLTTVVVGLAPFAAAALCALGDSRPHRSS